MFAWRNLSNANLLAAFEWLAARRDNGSAREQAASTSAPTTAPRPASTSAR